MKQWIFPQRIGRLGWIARILLALAVGIPLFLATEPSSPLRQYGPAWLFETLGWLLLFTIILYIFFGAHLPRARSLGLHGASLLVMFIPLLNTLLFMMFLLGSEGYWTRLQQKQRGNSPNEPNVA